MLCSLKNCHQTPLVGIDLGKVQSRTHSRITTAKMQNRFVEVGEDYWYFLRTFCCHDNKIVPNTIYHENLQCGNSGQRSMMQWNKTGDFSNRQSVSLPGCFKLDMLKFRMLKMC